MRAIARLVRRLGRRPGLTAARLLTLAVVVASVTAVFAIADTTLLKPLPFPHPERLVLVYLQLPGTTAFSDATALDRWEFKRYHAEVRRFEQLEGIEPAPMAVADGGEPESVRGGRVSAGFFDLLGAALTLGRGFTHDEVAADARVVVLGDGVWRRRFGADPAVVGKVIRIDREPYMVIGVTGPTFEPAFTNTEFWTPLYVRQTSPALFTSVRTIGRLPATHGAADALAELREIWNRMEAEAPVLKGWTVKLLDWHEAQFGSRRSAAWMLLAAAVALMLLASANLANLTLADVLARRGDFALSTALGGSRARIAGPEIFECLALAGIGGLLGVIGAIWLLPALQSLSPADAATDGPVRIDWRVWSASLAASALVMLASVVIPVWRAANPRFALAGAARRTTSGRGASLVRLALVGSQSALAVLLLTGGALVVRSFERAADHNPGFDPEHVLSAQVRLTADVLPTDAHRTAFVRRMLDELRGTPGVVAAGITLNPFVANGGLTTPVRIEDYPKPDGSPHSVQFRRVSPGYFETMRIRLLEGRVFDDHDVAETTPVAVVSRSFARRFWGDASPINRRIRRGAPNIWQTVVGVVDDVRDVGLDLEPAPTVYTAFYQSNAVNFPIALTVRTAGDPRAMESAVKRAVWRVDASQPLANVRTLGSFLSDTLGRRRFRAALVTIVGVIGVLLATIGIYGVTSRSVAERTREVGIRVALGGDARRVWVTMAGASARAVALGALLGAMASVLAMRGLSALLPEVSEPAWMAGGAAALLLAAVGAVTSMSAARRVLRVEPAQALRTG
jgi:predicted permease